MNGLAAALLGICAIELRQPIACLSSDPAASPERIDGNTVLEIVGSRIGMASYFSRLDALLQRPEFAHAAGKAPASGTTDPSKGGTAPLPLWLRPWTSLNNLQAHLCPSVPTGTLLYQAVHGLIVMLRGALRV